MSRRGHAHCCEGTVPRTAAATLETVPTLSHSYVVESNELVDVSYLKDGSIKHTDGSSLRAHLTGDDAQERLADAEADARDGFLVAGPITG